ncbi:Isopentenyl phosphate kinase [Linum perenne]
MKPQKSIISSTVLLHSSDSHQKNKLFSNFSAEEMDNSGKRESRNLPTIRCIVKLGGAAITCKNELEKINEENLGVVSLQLRQAMASVSENQKILGMDWSKRPGKSGICCDVDEFKDQMNSVDPANFVVVHGAGSFGHFQASKSGVHRGGLDKPIVKAGFVATRISVTTLNLEIVRALAGAGIPSIGMSPFSCGWLTSERNLASADLSMVAKAIESGFMPVLHGDAVLDKQLVSQYPI